MPEHPDDTIAKTLPDGWFCLWCPTCLASLTWTREVMQSYPFDEWVEDQNWCIDSVTHNLELHDIHLRDTYPKRGTEQ